LEKLTYLFLNLFFYISLCISNDYVKNIQQLIFFGKNQKKWLFSVLELAENIKNISIFNVLLVKYSLEAKLFRNNGIQDPKMNSR